MSLIAELKRRKVFKVGAAYLVVGWLLIQVASTLAPQLNLPEWAPRMATFVILLGFPITLLLAWMLEVGTEGIKIDVATVGNKRMFLIAAILAAIAVGWYWKTRPTPVTGDDANARSIAVLPFVNMSDDKGNEYFSDGISEEILNVLARTPDLRVAARTSSFSFKDSKQEAPEIARDLKVRMLLEGSVRKQGERVRVTAQLIDAGSGFHVWSQTYDRELKDIFAIQDEIAKAIGDALEVQLAGIPQAGKNSVGTTDLKAYDLYLRGVDLWQTRNEEELWQAVELFNQAIAVDPKFAQAYGSLALTYDVLPDYSARISYKEAIDRANDAAEMALGLDPSLPEPYVALAGPASFERRRSASITLFRRAIALRPSFATAYQWLGGDLMAAGDPAAALAALSRASELDPRSPVVASNYAFVLLTLGRSDEARSACERVVSFAPNFLDCLKQLAMTEMLRGNAEAARPFLLKIAQVSKPRGTPLANAVVDALQGRGDRDALAHQLAAFPGRSSLDPNSDNIFESDIMPVVLVMLGSRDLALDYLEQRVDDPDSSQLEWPLMLPALDAIRCAPRFTALVQKLKTNDPRAAAVCATGTK